MTVEEGWQDLLRRCPDLSQAYHRERRQQYDHRIFRRIVQWAAVAACLALVTMGGWLLSARFRPSSAAPYEYAELVMGIGRRGLALEQPVATRDRRQEILLGGMHRVVMNQNTSATFAVASQGGYAIRLARGELYVEVVPGHPFTVTTANARLNITGTKFNVKAEQDKTELTLLKGSVRFSASDHPGQTVSVAAGYASTVIGHSSPTCPTAADTVATMAWARDVALGNAVARIAPQPGVDLSFLHQDLWRQPDPPDPDTLDYAAWRDAHQGWFARQFPWISKARAALQKDPNVQADYIELLMVSGNIWQFHWDPRLSATQPFTKIEPLAVARLARHYGVDERELMRVAGLPESMPAVILPARTQIPAQHYAEGLQRWHDAGSTAEWAKLQGDTDTVAFGLFVSQYLANTRTAAYLWAKAYPQKAQQLLADSTYIATLTTPQWTGSKDEWLQQLRQHATAAQRCRQVAVECLMMLPGNGCTSEATAQQRTLAMLIGELVRGGPGYDKAFQGGWSRDSE